MATQGRSLELYFIDGRPDGMLTAEVFNWTGHVLKAPRTQIREALQRSAAQHTGLYIIVGEKDGIPLAYIGEGEDVSSRIKDHESKRDWWSEAIIISTTADNLHKAHVKYLESRLVEIARSTNAMLLENGNTPPRSSLSEASQANMEEFLDTLFIVLPALGIHMFTIKKRPDSVLNVLPVNSVSPRFYLETVKHGLRATAVLEDGEFVVLKGSFARNVWAGQGDHDHGYKELHGKLVLSGVIAPGPDRAVFIENYAFSSPSAAAAVVNGRPANGRIEWKAETDGRLYKVWEADQLRNINP